MIQFINKRAVYFIFLFLLFGCSKSESNQPKVPTVEEDIVYTIDIDPSSGIYSSIGSTQEMKVLISSKMPSGGVGVDLVVKKDSDGTTISSSSIQNTKSSSIILTISNLIGGAISTVTITVRSLSKPSNTLTRSFKIAKK